MSPPPQPGDTCGHSTSSGFVLNYNDTFVMPVCIVVNEEADNRCYTNFSNIKSSAPMLTLCYVSLYKGQHT